MYEYVNSKELKKIGLAVLEKNNVKIEYSNIVIDALLWASLRGVDSHGIRLLPHYVKGIKKGRLNINPNITFQKKSPSMGVLDADNTFGHYACFIAMKRCVDIAKETGIGAVSVKNSSHCGALTYYGHIAAFENMLGIGMTHATPRIKTPLSTKSFFGNNPVCIVAPMKDEDPFCFDASTSSITFNAVRAAAAAGTILPNGLVADKFGNETNDPNSAFQLMPIGGYKGFGLSMAVDIFCALLSGMPNGNNVSQMFGDNMHEKRKLGQFFCAINIEKLISVDSFKSDLQNMAERLRNEPTISSTSDRVMAPGDPEKKELEKRLATGIPILKKDLLEIKSLISSI